MDISDAQRGVEGRSAAGAESLSNGGLGAAMRTADTIERAIEIVRTEDTDCNLPWYGIGKTNADFREYLKKETIDVKALGVFIAGSEHNDTDRKLEFWPRSWIVENDSGPAH